MATAWHVKTGSFCGSANVPLALSDAIEYRVQLRAPFARQALCDIKGMFPDMGAMTPDKPDL